MLCTAIRDCTLSVRVSAASAAANVADALQQQQRQLDAQVTAPLLELAKGKLRPVHVSLGISKCNCQTQKCLGTCTRHIHFREMLQVMLSIGVDCKAVTHVLPVWVTASGRVN